MYICIPEKFSGGMPSLESIHIIYLSVCVHLVPGGPHAICNHNWLIAVQYNEDNV